MEDFAAAKFYFLHAHAEFTYYAPAYCRGALNNVAICPSVHPSVSLAHFRWGGGVIISPSNTLLQ